MINKGWFRCREVGIFMKLRAKMNGTMERRFRVDNWGILALGVK